MKSDRADFIISGHAEFDDARHWQFSRTSGLPANYFHRPRIVTAERVLVLLACAVIVWAFLPWGHA